MRLLPVHLLQMDQDLPRASSEAFARIVSERARWIAFLRSRGVSSEAEDVLQVALVKAFEKIGAVRPDDPTAWFYRLLRNTLIDHLRKIAAERKRIEALDGQPWGGEADLSATQSATTVCRCFLSRLDELNRRYAELIRRVDLEGASPSALAEESAQPVGSVHVALHRARQALRKDLEGFCRECATDGACLDCGCS